MRRTSVERVSHASCCFGSDMNRHHRFAAAECKHAASCRAWSRAGRRSRSKVVMTATNAPEAEQILSVDSIPARYKGILLDQFGVLHDGKTAYKGAFEATRRLAESGRKVVILSNSSRRSTNTIPRLQKLGFDGRHFAGAVTSGELTFTSLKDRPDAWWAALGRRCLHLTWGARGAVSLEGLHLQAVSEPEEADFVLAHGTEVLGAGEGRDPVPQTMEQFRGLLERATAKRIPLIVANPDVVTVSGESLVPMPGTFARWYGALGGEVRLMGKPDPIIYKAAMEAMGLAPDQVLAVGDSLEHDISGAAAAGIDSMFVLGGIHAEELGVSAAKAEPDAAVLTKLFEEHNATPQYMTPYLT